MLFFLSITVVLKVFGVVTPGSVAIDNYYPNPIPHQLHELSEREIAKLRTLEINHTRETR